MKLLTTSRKKCYRACPRLHHYEYELGYRPAIDAEELRFGTLTHAGLEAFYLALKANLPAAGDSLEAALAAIREKPSDPFDLAKAEVMLTGYWLRWNAEPLEVLAVEQQFEAPLINPATHAASRTWRLAGKIDVIVRCADGLVRLMEHKTSGEDISPASEYWKRLRMDGQISDYFAGAKSLGYDVAGCLYDVLGKPELRPKQIPLVDGEGVKIVLDAAGNRVRTKDGKKWRETGDSAAGYALQTRDETPDEFRARLTEAVSADPDRYYQRGEVVRLERELAEAEFESWQLGQQIRESELAQRAPRNPDACTRYGRTCSFFPVCSGEASLDDTTRFRRITQVHEELTQQEGAAP